MRPLTPRQQQILRLKCATGKTNKEIAAELGIGTRQVANQLTFAYRNYDAKSMAQACWRLRAGIEPVEAMRAGDV
jgi:DNA-binding NarL/FixJ family response regulator